MYYDFTGRMIKIFIYQKIGEQVSKENVKTHLKNSKY